MVFWVRPSILLENREISLSSTIDSPEGEGGSFPGATLDSSGGKGGRFLVAKLYSVEQGFPFLGTTHEISG
jgi:hypothetical protein